MNNPPPPQDRQQLPDPPSSTQRLVIPQNPLLGANTTGSQIPGFSLPTAGLPPAAVNDLNNWNKLSQSRGVAPTAMTPAPAKLDALNLLGAAVQQHQQQQQQQQMQNAGILQSLMNQKQQITKYEDEIRRRMMLPPSNPLLQAHLVQNDPGRFLGSMGLLGSNLGMTLMNPRWVLCLLLPLLPLFHSFLYRRNSPWEGTDAL